MKKVIKVLLSCLIAIICICILLIAEESIRLKNGGMTPIVIIGKDSYCDGDKKEHLENSYKTSCRGIGYQIKREYILDEESKKYIKIKEEFWLFDKILLWGWVS